MSRIEKHVKRPKLLSMIGPGILVAATGVGAGDLSGAGFAGSQLGVAVLWAVLVGAFFKFVLAEGLTRWQLATGQTLLEGVARRLGKWAGYLFLPYFLLWSYVVGTALMAANGVTLYAVFPVFEEASQGKVVFGILSSLVGLILVRRGGFKLFEKVMGVCIFIMFFTVVASAIVIAPPLPEVIKGLLIPSIPNPQNGGIAWTMALIGGIGSTVTILCYGYWIAEEGRHGPGMLKFCRVDLGVGYVMIAIFGVAMVIIGSTVGASGTGAGLIIEIADSLESSLGPVGRWAFLIGALGAVFSSLLGVWQSAPYLFADIWRLFISRKDHEEWTDQGIVTSTHSLPYKGYLYAIATVPMIGLLVQFREIQKTYGIIAVGFLPLLTVALILLNGRTSWIGKFKNHPFTVVVLISVLVFFGWMAWQSWF